MGQKASPISLRLPITKDWSSRWFSEKKMSDFIAEDDLIKSLIIKKIGFQGGINKVVINRSAQEIKIIINTSKPGIIIGRSGQGVNDLKKLISNKIMSFRQKTNQIKTWKIKNYSKPKITLDKIDIKVNEIREPETYANLVAQNIASQIEKRVAYRRAIKQAITKSSANKKVLGIKVSVSGRLDGVEIARNEKFGIGSIPLSKFKKTIDYAKQTANTTYGAVGIKVWIYKQEISE